MTYIICPYSSRGNNTLTKKDKIRQTIVINEKTHDKWKKKEFNIYERLQIQTIMQIKKVLQIWRR